VLAQTPDSCRDDAANWFLYFVIAIRQTDEAEALRALEGLVGAPNFHNRMLPVVRGARTYGGTLLTCSSDRSRSARRRLPHAVGPRPCADR
jgi:hypothetical protein